MYLCIIKSLTYCCYLRRYLVWKHIYPKVLSVRDVTPFTLVPFLLLVTNERVIITSFFPVDQYIIIYVIYTQCLVKNENFYCELSAKRFT